jgi:hypothetical protein
MPKTKERVLGYAGNAKPYVERALNDDELRDHVKQAYAAAREIYDELIGPRGPVGLATRVATDKEIQENLKTTLDELRRAAERLQGKDAHKGRNTMLLVTGIALGILFNPVTGPETRRWLKDKLFGDGEFGFESGGNGAAA